MIQEIKNIGVSVYVNDLGGLDITSHTDKMILTTLAVAEIQPDKVT